MSGPDQAPGRGSQPSLPSAADTGINRATLPRVPTPGVSADGPELSPRMAKVTPGDLKSGELAFKIQAVYGDNSRGLYSFPAARLVPGSETIDIRSTKVESRFDEENHSVIIEIKSKAGEKLQEMVCHYDPHKSTLTRVECGGQTYSSTDIQALDARLKLFRFMEGNELSQEAKNEFVELVKRMTADQWQEAIELYEKGGEDFVQRFIKVKESLDLSDCAKGVERLEEAIIACLSKRSALRNWKQESVERLLGRWERNPELSFDDIVSVHQAIEAFIAEFNSRGRSHDGLRDAIRKAVPDPDSEDRALLEIADEEIKRDWKRFADCAGSDKARWRTAVRFDGMLGLVSEWMRTDYYYHTDERYEYSKLFFGTEFADPMYSLYYQTHGYTSQSDRQIVEYLRQIVTRDGKVVPKLQEQAVRAWDRLWGDVYKDASWYNVGYGWYHDSLDELVEMLKFELSGSRLAEALGLIGKEGE